jgi:hypothetical protein
MNENIPFIPGMFLVILGLLIIVKPLLTSKPAELKSAIGGFAISVMGIALLFIASELYYG